MVERVLCKHEVVGSIPSDSTIKPSAAAIAEFKFPSQLIELPAANLTS